MRLNKNKWRKRLSVKVIFAFVVGTVLSITLIVAAILWLSFYQKSTLAMLDVSDVASKIGKTLVFSKAGLPLGLDIADGELNWVFDSMPNDVAYRVLNQDGMTQLSSVPVDKLWGVDNLEGKPIDGHFYSSHNEIPYHNVLAKVMNNGDVWYIQITVSERFYSFVHTAFSLPFMMMGIVLFSLVLLFIFGACAWVIIGYTLKPLRELSESATEISPRTIGARLSLDGIPLEILPLVESFNRVLERLENGFRIQQEFMAKAAHELKTPLALIRAQIELKEKSEEREVLLNDVEHMTRHVQQLLMLAEVSEEQNYKLSHVIVTDVLNEVIVFLKPMTSKNNVNIEVSSNPDVIWQADGSALFVLLKNLVENAIQHTPQNSLIQINIEPNCITVRDEGSGANDDELEHMFERFWRGAHRRDHGAGLGLSICKEIAQAHGWQLSVLKAAPGLAFKISSPKS